MTIPDGFDPKQAHVVSQWPHDRPLNACRFDPAGRFVFCGSEDAAVERFNLADGVRTIINGGHQTWVHAIAFSKDGSMPSAADATGKLTWWESAAAEPKPIRTIDAHKGWIRSLDVSPGRHAAGQRRQRQHRSVVEHQRRQSGSRIDGTPATCVFRGVSSAGRVSPQR